MHRTLLAILNAGAAMFVIGGMMLSYGSNAVLGAILFAGNVGMVVYLIFSRDIWPTA